MQYRKKPVTIDAIQFNGSNFDEIQNFCSNKHIFDCGSYIVIPTLEGNHNANINDFIIRGIAGEYYPCKPDIFEQTYEPVE